MGLNEEDKKGIPEDDLYLFENSKGEKILSDISQLLEEIERADNSTLDYLLFQINDTEGVNSGSYGLPVWFAFIHLMEKSYKKEKEDAV